MISVIIPTLHEERYIEKTLVNLFRFKPEIEIIIVDGDSKDKTVEVAFRYADRVLSVTSRGIAKAKNLGAKHAKGDILIFIDADVLVPNNFLQKVTKVFEDQSIVAATCKIMPIKPRTLEFIYFSLLNLSIRFSIQALAKTKFKLGSRGEFIAVRKNEFQKVRGFNEKIACLEDFDFTFRLFKFRKFTFIQDLVVYESLRRIRKRGLFKMLRIWTTNYVAYQTYGLPKSRVWEVVR